MMRPSSYFLFSLEKHFYQHQLLAALVKHSAPFSMKGFFG
jgi:hypothetical protein